MNVTGGYVQHDAGATGMHLVHDPGIGAAARHGGKLPGDFLFLGQVDHEFLKGLVGDHGSIVGQQGRACCSKKKAGRTNDCSPALDG